jgi:type IV pilus assembly protein PilN
MRISINLASRPYIDLAPYLRRLRIWIAVLAVLAIPFFALWRVEATRAADATAEEDRLQASSTQLRNEQARYKAQMQQQSNAAVLNQSVFLNSLFAQKSFSWTAVMMDLETVMPAGVQVNTLEPAVRKDGSVFLRMRVNGPRDKTVQMLRNLEHAKRFVAPRLAGETAENKQDKGSVQTVAESGPLNVTFDILADYNPLAPVEKADKSKKDEAEDDTAVTENPTPKPAIHKTLVPVAAPRPSAAKPGKGMVR